MRFKETKLKGAYVIELELLRDDRGFFARSFCREEFNKYDLNFQVAQCNVSYNKKRGTLRGMHYQAAPHEEDKLIRCIKGSMYDVIIDLRPDSPTFKQWISIELVADNYTMLYVPKGFAHGFQTLLDDTEVFYQMSELHYPEFARGVRWDDPAFGITWPISQPILSPKDCSYPFFKLGTE